MKRLSEIKVLEDRIKCRVRSLHGFSGVPRGTTGVVEAIYRKDNDHDGTIVRWDLEGGPVEVFDRMGLVDENDLLEVIE